MVDGGRDATRRCRTHFAARDGRPSAWARDGTHAVVHPLATRYSGLRSALVALAFLAARARPRPLAWCAARRWCTAARLGCGCGIRLSRVACFAAGQSRLRLDFAEFDRRGERSGLRRGASVHMRVDWHAPVALCGGHDPLRLERVWVRTVR